MHPLRHVWIYVLLFDTPPCVGGIVRVAPATSWNDASTCNSGSIVHTNCITCDRTTYYYRCHERASVRLVLILVLRSAGRKKTPARQTQHHAEPAWPFSTPFNLLDLAQITENIVWRYSPP